MSLVGRLLAAATCVTLGCGRTSFSSSSGTTASTTASADAGKNGSGSTSTPPQTPSPANSTDQAGTTPTSPNTDLANAGCTPGKGLIDFESIPDGTVHEGMVISDQYKATFGVSFSTTDGSPLLIAKVNGTNPEAYECSSADCSSPINGLRPGQEAVGSYFLTEGTGSDTPPDILITFEKPVAATSAVLIDLDNAESWQIQALDESGNQVGLVSLQSPQNLYYRDGVQTYFSFDHGTVRDIQELKFHGFKPGGHAFFGFAFDNFTPDGTCSAATLGAKT